SPSEILIIDHDSSDDTYSLIENFKERHTQIPISLWQCKLNHMARSRHELLGRAKNEFIAYINGDCLPPKDWLEQLIRGYYDCKNRDPYVVGVGGPNRLAPSTEVHKGINIALDWIPSSSPQILKPKYPQKVDHIATANCLFERKALIRVGGFSPHFPQMGEDLEIGRRLLRSGKSLYLLAHPVVINNCNRNFGEWLRRMYRLGRAQSLELSHGGSWSKVSGIALWSLPLLGLLLLMSVFFNEVRSAILIYLLFSMVFVTLRAGLQACGRLSPHIWMCLHFSPVAYSLGFWSSRIHLLENLTSRAKNLLTNVSSHLQTTPTHLLRLLVGMPERLRNRRT
ncbi:MAG: glycosyltransferase, partial [Bdellovibrionales bacterium]|nr:glycosyltransferase [Bdellovibrionales bacterium]